MGAAYFYQLTERPLEATLPVLIQKSLEAGWRVAVQSGESTRLDRLDKLLWNGDGFLPHGLAGGAHDAEQPVLLTTKAPTNGATCLMIVDGASVSAEDVNASERVCILFNGADQSELELARAQWKNLTQAGVAAQYWSDEDGRWVKKAENVPDQG